MALIESGTALDELNDLAKQFTRGSSARGDGGGLLDNALHAAARLKAGGTHFGCHHAGIYWVRYDVQSFDT